MSGKMVMVLPKIYFGQVRPNPLFQRGDKTKACSFPRNGWSWLAGLSLLLAPFVVYAPLLDAGYIWDDNALVTDNLTLRSLDGLRRMWFVPGATPQYYPATYSSFWVEYRLWGLDPMVSHLLNVLLHALSAFVLWRVLRFLRVPGAWLAAALFALHPVYVESVAWISERKNVLSGLFYLTSAWAFLRYALAPKPGWWLYGTSFLLFVLALFSKTVTCSLPAVLIIVIWWKRGAVDRRTVMTLLPFFAVGAGLGVSTVWIEKHFVGAEGADWDLNWVERFLIAGRALWFYAGKLVWPDNLTFIYPRWVINTRDGFQYLYPLTIVVLVSGLWFARDHIGRGPLAAVLIFCGTLLPALGFLDVYPMRYSFVADHFQYLASVGLLALFGAGLTRVAERMGSAGTVLKVTAVAGLLATLGFLTWQQTHMYRDRETLWRETLARNPAAWIAHVNLGGALVEQEKFAEASELYERAAQLDVRKSEPLINLGVIHHLQDDSAQALLRLREALEREPDSADAHANMGRVLIASGELEQAERHLKRALEQEPNHGDAHNQLGIVFKQRRQWSRAEAHFRAALRIRPDSAEALNNLGVVMEGQGQRDAAMRYYLTAINARPDQASAHINLGRMFAGSGRLDESIAHFRTALDLDPQDAFTHQHLGRGLVQKGDLVGARSSFETAARLRPDWTVPLNALAWMLATHPLVGESDRPAAVEFAERAAQLSQRRDPSILDTLAAAYAGSGRFDEAVKVADEAIGLAEKANAPALVRDIRERHELYARSKRYREPPTPGLSTHQTAPRDIE